MKIRLKSVFAYKRRSIYTHTHVRAYKAQQYAMRESVPLDLQTSVSSGEHFGKGASHAVIKAIFIPAAV